MSDQGKKHPCPDCSCCQWCGDIRCSMCLRGAAACRKLSLQEQIKLYERLNRREEMTDTSP